MLDEPLENGTVIRVVDPHSPHYDRKGVVKKPLDGATAFAAYECSLYDTVEGCNDGIDSIAFMPFQLEPYVKRFHDIERLVEEDEEIAEGIVKCRNCDNFQYGLNIQISEKVDGANSSIKFNTLTGRLSMFSRNKEITGGGVEGFRGFYEYITSTFDAREFSQHPYCDYVFFGEWLVPHTVRYDKERYEKWYVYDIYDVTEHVYLPQSKVSPLCDKFGFEYVNILYEGPFTSWDHVRSFMNRPHYGPKQEGVVVKLQCDEIPSLDPSQPRVLKLVNKDYLETKHVKKSIREADVIAAQDAALANMADIVTKARVLKELHKCRDEGLIPERLKNSDMGLLLCILPKRVFEDCMKEEPETVETAGKNAGKVSYKLVVEHLREIVLGLKRDGLDANMS